MSGVPELVFNLKFSGKPVIVDTLGPENTISDLKNEIFAKTMVARETQKILGLRTVDNVPVTDDLKLSQIILKPSTKLMLIGSTQEAIVNVNTPIENPPDVIDDFDFKPEDVQICYLPENLEKVMRRSKAYRPRKLCDPRPGKKLLVLDVDYTIFDHLTPTESVRQLARPFLHEFLTRAYVSYDIAIWSATSLTWILAKLAQLGVIPTNSAAILRNQQLAGESGDPRSPRTSSSTVSETRTSQEADQPVDETGEPKPPFKVCLLLDSSDMISVNFPLHGVKEVKPLAVIWDNHPQWGPQNTIMFDDIRRNFVMNPHNGLRIRSYRDAHVNSKTDRELRGLARYLELINEYETDFSTLNHNHWERYISKHRSRKSQKRSLKDTDGCSHLHGEQVISKPDQSSASGMDLPADQPMTVSPSSDGETGADAQGEVKTDQADSSKGLGEPDLK